MRGESQPQRAAAGRGAGAGRHQGPAASLQPRGDRRPQPGPAGFPTQEEAIARCFAFGRRIIDGKVKGRIVSDL